MKFAVCVYCTPMLSRVCVSWHRGWAEQRVHRGGAFLFCSKSISILLSAAFTCLKGCQ